jgi:Domain of unknown function (DUF4062)/AAA ATPase domain
MAEHLPAASESREIRVFLSSTFVDFQEERELLVKRVFPSLRRRAASRGVEIVDVDLRWGVTEEMTQQGQTLPLCLAEIDRCRPYFIGLLGERHGWVPPAEFYRPELLQQQPWLSEHQGGASVTELEILHGVLRNPKMAGYARFYLRDPAYALAQQDPAWLAQGEKEHQRLETLKQKVRDSGFPVVEGLATPEAIASRIEADLWELIKEQYPDLDEADALQREERQHASYRRSRLGIYLGGKRSINQLERWIDAGQQKILITGESGAGKSALIANWIEAHHQHHPEDVVFAHHLGCSNDASAIRPLLARLIDTAKQQMPEVYGYSLSVPQDWWELVAKAVEALHSLGRWAQQNNHRWIWVLDGLDRLDSDDQKALPWLPLIIPKGVVIMASALECPAREILLERKFKTRTIAPLKAKEQDALIKQFLGRYTKQLIAELRQSILGHPLAGSPLFLRVLLEELRQCGRYETLAEQLVGYLSAESTDGLYERVLERLEADGNGKNVSKVMSALWASRAGLSEEELLSITGLKPLQWAPIDLALGEALGRNGNRLVFDHDYLRKAVEDRYLLTEEERRQAHSDLADWFGSQDEWDERKAVEWPWQLLKAERTDDFNCLACDTRGLFEMSRHLTSQQMANLLRASCIQPRHLEGQLTREFEQVRLESNIGEEIPASAISTIIESLDYFGISKNLLLNFRYYCVWLEIKAARKDWLFTSPQVQGLHANTSTFEGANASSVTLTDAWIKELRAAPRRLADAFITHNSELFKSLCNLAKALGETGMYGKAKQLYDLLIKISEHSETGLSGQISNMLIEYTFLELNKYDQDNLGQYGAVDPYLQNARRLIEAVKKSLREGKTEADSTTFRLLQALIDIEKRDTTDASEILILANNLLSQKRFYLGSNHHETLESEWQLAVLAAEMARDNDFDVDDFASEMPEWVKPIRGFPQRYSNMYGEKHPASISKLSEFASHCRIARLYEEARHVQQSAYELASESLDSNEPVFSQVRKQYSLLLTTLAERTSSASTSSSYRLEALRLLEDEWQIQSKASHNDSDLAILECQINLVELCREAGLDHKSFKYLNNIVYSATMKLGCDHPVVQHALLAISNLGWLPGFHGEIDFSGFYHMVFDVCEWMLDHSFAIPPITLNDLILFSCRLAQGLNKDDSRLVNALITTIRNTDHESALLLNDLSTLAWLNQDFEQAIAMLTRVMESSEIKDYASEAVRLCLLDKLGVFLRDAGECTRSIGCFEKTYVIRCSRCGDYAFETVYSAIQLAASRYMSGSPTAIRGLIDYLSNMQVAASLSLSTKHLVLSLFPDEAFSILGPIDAEERRLIYARPYSEQKAVKEICAAIGFASHLSCAR